jgi:hypothetical protein
MTADISADGVQLSLPARVEPGSRVELRLAVLKPPTTFRLQGKVAWTREGREPGTWLAGVEIINEQSKHTQAWQAYVHAVQAALPAPRSFHMRFRDDGAMW